MLGRKFYLFIVAIFYYLPVHAGNTVTKPRAVFHGLPMSDQNKSSIGGIADNTFEFFKNIGQIFKGASITVGIGLVLFGILQYQKYRNNPAETSLSTVIVIIIIGIGLIALSLIPMKY